MGNHSKDPGSLLTNQYNGNLVSRRVFILSRKITIWHQLQDGEIFQLFGVLFVCQKESVPESTFLDPLDHGIG